ANVKFDKVVVWEGGGDAKNGTAGFLRGLAGALPPMMHMMKDIGGVEMPPYFGKLVDDAGAAPAATPATNGSKVTPSSSVSSGSASTTPASESGTTKLAK